MLMELTLAGGLVTLATGITYGVGLACGFSVFHSIHAGIKSTIERVIYKLGNYFTLKYESYLAKCYAIRNNPDKHKNASLFQRFIASIVRSLYNLYMRVGLKMSEQDIKDAAMAGAATA
jgi:hypothetical protein